MSVNILIEGQPDFELSLRPPLSEPEQTFVRLRPQSPNYRVSVTGTDRSTKLISFHENTHHFSIGFVLHNNQIMSLGMVWKTYPNLLYIEIESDLRAASGVTQFREIISPLMVNLGQSIIQYNDLAHLNMESKQS